MRRGFQIAKPLKRATLQSSGLGCHEVYCNGLKVGRCGLGFGDDTVQETVLYVEHDVSDLLKPGPNVFGVMLGHGWYAHDASTAWNFDRAEWHDLPKLLLKLRLYFADGSEQTIVSDTSWKAAAGPVLMDDFMNGEIYDARAESPGWMSPKFNDSKWVSAEVMAAPKGTLRAQTIAPIRVTQTIKPVAVNEVRPGVFLFDFGQKHCRLGSDCT